MDKSTWDRAFSEACVEVQKPAVAPTHTGPVVEVPPLSPDSMCADEGGGPPGRPKHMDSIGRYDYVFVDRPTAKHAYRLEVSRIRRRPFKRAQVTESEQYLSDHIGLDLTLYLSPR